MLARPLSGYAAGRMAQGGLTGTPRRNNPGGSRTKQGFYAPKRELAASGAYRIALVLAGGPELSTRQLGSVEQSVSRDRLRANAHINCGRQPRQAVTLHLKFWQMDRLATGGWVKPLEA